MNLAVEPVVGLSTKLVYNTNRGQLLSLQAVTLRDVFRCYAWNKHCSLFFSGRFLTEGKTQKYLWAKIHFWSPATLWTTQNSQGVWDDLLSVPRVRTKHGEAAFSYYAPNIWNKLPESCRSAATLTTLKKLNSLQSQHMYIERMGGEVSRCVLSSPCMNIFSPHNFS